MMPVPAGAARSTTRPAPMATRHVMMQGAALTQRHTDHRALGTFRRLADRLRHFAGLALAKADPAFLVTDNHQRGKAEPATALHHLGDAVDVNQLVREFVVTVTIVEIGTGHAFRTP